MRTQYTNPNTQLVPAYPQSQPQRQHLHQPKSIKSAKQIRKSISKWRSQKNTLLASTISILSAYSTNEIAARTGISKTTITKWRSGQTTHPNSGTLLFVLKHFGRSINIT